MNSTNDLISGDSKGYASYLMEQHMNNGALPGKVYARVWLCGVIIVDYCRAHLWQHFLRVMLEMSLLTLLVHDVLTPAFPVTIRLVPVMERCVHIICFKCVYVSVCVCMCVCVRVGVCDVVWYSVVWCICIAALV